MGMPQQEPEEEDLRCCSGIIMAVALELLVAGVLLGIGWLAWMVFE